MHNEKIAFQSMKEQAALVAAKKVSPVELTQLYLDRIERYNPKVVSYNTVAAEMALDAARKAESEIAKGQHKGPLHGIPVAVKDQMNIIGVPNTGGSRYYREYIADNDATVVANLKKAGTVLLGTLSTAEFSMGGTTEYVFGTPRNPWDLERTPGGSSSGAGSSVAAGLVGGAVGEDTGGSIRGPASLCGIVGLKPTWSRISRAGVWSLCWSMDCAGPMTRTVEDAAIMLRVLAGYDPRDPMSSREPVPDYTAQLRGGIKGLRIGVVEELLDDTFNADTRLAVNAAIKVLADQGAVIERVSLPLINEALGVHSAVVDVEAASYHRPRLMDRYFDLDYNTRLRALVGALLPAGMYSIAARARAALANQVLQAMKRFDVIVGATSTAPAGKLSTGTGINSKEDALTKMYGRPGNTAFSMAGTPAISIPCGLSSEGLPIGLQIAGRLFDEATVLKVAYTYEQVTDWHTKHPPLFAA